MSIDNKKVFFMQKALRQADLAFKKNEVPIGAVIVDADGNIIARAHNQVEHQKCQMAHAEILAIKKACRKKGSWRLSGCWIYVTLEPCLMCFGLIQLSRIEGIIYGAKSSLFGVSLYGLNKKLPPPLAFAKNLKIEGDIEAQKSIDLLKTFFSQARKKTKEKGLP